MVVRFEDELKEALKSPQVKEEFDALEEEFMLIQSFIDARKRSGFSQQELSRRTGITQADISKIECGNANPSFRTLKRLAAGMGMKCHITFVPD
ncbi:MAG: helix-turn-helix transcriptional regulator [Bradymonadales bacterium]|jgi:ribosome-binding protein aMBF1 (putative translation factor)